MATQTIPSWLEKYGRKFEIERRRREQVELAASQIVELLHARIARLSEIVESAHGLALRLTDPRPAEFERHSGIGFESYH